MALFLPADFASDIQGKDTALFPVVVIGNVDNTISNVDLRTISWQNESIIISTNSFTINGQSGGETSSVAVKPILLNIPSLKESIDIEKRNYKISSINLDISNYEYQGTRFSELVSGSLINVECRIYWFSPSTAQPTTYITYNSDAFQVYNGTIRRYTHDDEKVKLVVEDRSQATLHKDLPLLDNYLGTDDNYSDKSKGKPMPMVYGHVDRSPCVLGKNNRSVIVDSQQIAGYVPGAYGVLYLYPGDYYIDVMEAQYDVDSTPNQPARIFFDSNNVDIYGSGEDGVVNMLKCMDVSKNYNINLSASTIDPDYQNYTTGDFVPDDSLDFWTDGSYGVNEVPSIISGRYIETNDNVNSVTQHADVVLFKHDTNGNLSIEFRALYTAVRPSTPINYEVLLLKIGLSFTPQYEYAEDKDIKVRKFYINEHSLQNIIEYGDYYALVSKTVPSGINWGGGADDTNINYSVFSPITNLPSQYSILETLFSFQSISYDQTGDLHVDVAHNNTTSENYIRTFFTLFGHINEIDLTREVYAANVFNKNFYANVDGRGYGTWNGGYPRSPNAVKAISHILENELDVDPALIPPEAPMPDGYDYWQYAFTINKKINSKKLIEGIASASSYIPRFDNMGNFRLDVIKKEYQWDEPIEQDHVIKEADVISSSFSRTPIEDVITKVVLKYKWDYAKEEFDKDLTWSALPTGYERDYYGITVEESTLTIDDDRGKYIRDQNTAMEFARWYGLFHCNQHLKIKCRMPLKYMSLEIGDIVQFDKIIGDVKPYGIDYHKDAGWEGVGGQEYHGDRVNEQQVYPYFMVESTNKTLEWVEFSCIQMHNLSADYTPASVRGVKDEAAWNYLQLSVGGYADDVNDIDEHDESISLVPPRWFDAGANFLDPLSPSAYGASPAFNAKFRKYNVCPLLHLPNESPQETYASNFPEGADGTELEGIYYYDSQDSVASAKQLWDQGTDPELYSIHECAWEDVNEHELTKGYPKFEKYGENPWYFMDDTAGYGDPLRIPIKFKTTSSPDGQAIGFEPDYEQWWEAAPFTAESPSGSEPWLYLRFNHENLQEVVNDTWGQLFLHFDWYALLKEFGGYDHFFAFDSIKIEVLNDGWFYNGVTGSLNTWNPGTHSISFTAGQHNDYVWQQNDQNWQTVHYLNQILGIYKDNPTAQWSGFLFTFDFKITVTNEYYIENTTYLKLRLGTNDNPIAYGSETYGG